MKKTQPRRRLQPPMEEAALKDILGWAHHSAGEQPRERGTLEHAHTGPGMLTEGLLSTEEEMPVEKEHNITEALKVSPSIFSVKSYPCSSPGHENELQTHVCMLVAPT